MNTPTIETADWPQHPTRGKTKAKFHQFSLPKNNLKKILKIENFRLKNSQFNLVKMGDPDTACVRIMRSLDGRMQSKQKKITLYKLLT